MKQRFSSLDVKVIAYELSDALCTLRLANVYDLSTRVFVLKFAKPNNKQQIVIDSGFRCHLTEFVRVTAASPSVFVARLRKFLKTRRVTAVSQIGTDRIIDLQFSDGQYRLFLEFYAGGNIVLTDKELNILALLRIFTEGGDQEELRVGLKYSLENRQNYNGIPPLTKERVEIGLRTVLDKGPQESMGTGKKSKKQSGNVLRKALVTSLAEFPPVLVDHAFRVKEFDHTTPIEEVLADESLFDRLMEVLYEAKRTIEEITSAEVSPGYIIARIKERASNSTNERVDKKENLLYEDFSPFKPKQFEDNPEIQILRFERYNETVDTFFSSIEGQKLESRLAEREEHAENKLESARNDHQRRVGGLQQMQELNVRKARAIEANLERVKEAITAVNGLIAQGMDWVEIARLIEMEQARNNAVAEMIKLPLKLYENTATLVLTEPNFEDEPDFEGDETGSEVSDSDGEISTLPERKANAKPADKQLTVDVDLALSPWSNAREYYDQKKSAAVKEQKTLQSSEMALKSTEKKINADLKKGLKQEKDILRPVRKQLWFEKFYYFISSEGYLVLGGKDATQNEILYKKYLSKGDVYVHADLPGAASVVIKNNPNQAGWPIPPSTLSQAGNFCVITSSAWDSKAIMAAWWVNSDQVSKVDSTGQYLAAGTFVIKGKKIFLPPTQLLLGFGVMFQISPESKARHLKHRVHDDSPPVIAKDDRENQGISLTGETDQKEEGNQSSYETEQSSEARSTSEHDIKESGLLGSDRDGEKGQQVKLDIQYQNPLQLNGDSTIASEEKEVKSTDQASAEENSDDDSAADGGTEDINTDAVSRDAMPNNSADIASAQDARSRIHSTTKSKAPQLQVTSQVRGKRSQRNKQKNKYAHQDKGDRAIALRLLGSAAGQQKAVSEVETKAAREAELLVQKERRREQHLRAQQGGKDSEELRARRMQEGVETMDPEEIAELVLVTNFVGITLPGDEVMDSLVVCGPWDAIGARFRWRAKMQPGTLKKGKAVREILGAWEKGIAEREKKGKVGEREQTFGLDQGIRREAELVKALRDVEVNGVVPVSRCRVMAAPTAGSKTRGGEKGGKGKGGGRA